MLFRSKTMAEASVEDLKIAIKSINFFNNKAINIHKTAHIVQEQYAGEIPSTLEALVKLPGVGRKTANVVLGQAFGKQAITVDTHVKRVSYRLGFTKQSDPVKVEQDLIKVWREDIWSYFSSILILHGRHTCKAISPQCHNCEFQTDCPRKGVK